MKGEVIGVNVLASYNSIDPKTGVGERNEGLGFAIPSSTASVVVKGLRSGHFNRGLLGVFLEPLSESDAVALGLGDKKGALVTRVIEGSPAEQAGIKANDVILKIDGAVVTSDRDCLRKISLLQPEQTAAFTIWRDKAELVVSITVISRDKVIQSSLDPASATQATVSFDALGVTLRTAPLATGAGLGPDAVGIYVDQAANSVDLASLGLRHGDRITAVGSHPVASLDDVAKEIDAAKAQKLGAVLFYIETPMGGKTHTSVRLK
jgi:serine protease Do